MTLKHYFGKNTGWGVLSTADKEGHVNSALFSRPHFMGDGSIAFIMNERRSFKNVMENSTASFLFKEKGPGYRGIRLSLTKIKHERDPELIAKLSRRRYHVDNLEKKKTRYLVYFSVDEQRPLVGDED